MTKEERKWEKAHKLKREIENALAMPFIWQQYTYDVNGKRYKILGHPQESFCHSHSICIASRMREIYIRVEGRRGSRHGKRQFR